MGWIARAPLASAVSNAGGLGIIETSSGETDNCIAEIAKMRDLTDRPFGINLPLLFLRDARMVDAVCNAPVTFVSTSAGAPGKLLGPLKAAGKVVYHVVPTRSEEHTSELQSLMRISYAVFCLKQKTISYHRTLT